MREFSGVTQIIAAIVKWVKKSLRLQAIIRMMQKPGNNFIQLVALIYLLLIFKFCPLTLPSCIIFHVVSPTRSTQHYSAGAYSHFCLLLHAQINPIPPFFQNTSSALSHSMQPIPATLCLVWFHDSSPQQMLQCST